VTGTFEIRKAKFDSDPDFLNSTLTPISGSGGLIRREQGLHVLADDVPFEVDTVPGP
jgi:hypothetical protein